MEEDDLTKICRVLTEYTGQDVRPDDKFADIGLESLDAVEAILAIEDEFPEVYLDDLELTGDTTARMVLAAMGPQGDVQ